MTPGPTEESGEAIDEPRARLTRVRASGDPDALADALAQYADACVRRGRLRQGAESLDEAVAIHQSRQRPWDAARCQLFAATALRLAGDLDGAEQRARAALESGAPALAASAHGELGEIALVRGEAEPAERSFASAIAAGATARFFEKRAQALAALGRWGDAANAAGEARRRYGTSGEGARALAALVAEATARAQAGENEEAARLTLEGLAESDRLAARGPRAELRLLAAGRAAAGGDPRGSLDLAAAARKDALEGVAPGAYVTASLAMSRAADLLGDRLAAYAALATGWATLADLLGKATAESAFRPAVEALRGAWGPDAFARVKAAHDAARQA